MSDINFVNIIDMEKPNIDGAITYKLKDGKSLSEIIDISCFVELTNIGKIIFPGNKSLQQNIPASIFNLCFYLGDLVEPVIGSWLTKNFNFQVDVNLREVFLNTNNLKVTIVEDSDTKTKLNK